MSKQVFLKVPSILTIGAVQSNVSVHAEKVEYNIPPESANATIVTEAGVNPSSLAGLFVTATNSDIVVNPAKDNQLYDMFFPVISGNFSSPMEPSKVVTSYEWTQSIIYEKIVSELFAPVVFAGIDLTNIITINTNVAAEMTNGFVGALRNKDVTRNLYRQMFAQDPGRFLGRDPNIAIPFTDGDQINFVTKLEFAKTVFVPDPTTITKTRTDMFSVLAKVPEISYTPSPIYLTTGVKIGVQ